MTLVWLGALLLLTGVVFHGGATPLARAAQRWQTAPIGGAQRHAGTSEADWGLWHQVELARSRARLSRSRSLAGRDCFLGMDDD